MTPACTQDIRAKAQNSRTDAAQTSQAGEASKKEAVSNHVQTAKGHSTAMSLKTGRTERVYKCDFLTLPDTIVMTIIADDWLSGHTQSRHPA